MDAASTLSYAACVPINFINTHPLISLAQQSAGNRQRISAGGEIVFRLPVTPLAQSLL